MHRSIIVIAHDIRSTHNVGSLLRTAEGLGQTSLAERGRDDRGRSGEREDRRGLS